LLRHAARALGELIGATLVQGPLTTEAVVLALLSGPLQLVSQYAGLRLFHIASANTYARVAYVIITHAGLVGMPLLDRWPP
jgi:hypothetical protein